MKLFFGSALSKLIATIMAMFMPLTTLTAAVNTDKPAPTPFKDHANVVDKILNPQNYEIELVEDNTANTEETAVPEETATPEEAAATEEVTEPEAAAPTANEDAATPVDETNTDNAAQLQGAAEAQGNEEVGSEPVKTWGVSATENDDVTMSYYNEGDESFLDTVTGAIKAIFLPMTALAAEEAEAQTQTYENGTVVISGTGKTAPMLFTRWLKADEFVAAYEQWCTDNNTDIDTFYIAKENLDENGYEIGPAVSAVTAHEGFATNEAMLEEYLPLHISRFVMQNENFWTDYAVFNPTRVIINGNIDTISFAAFALCSNVTYLEINAPITNYESSAFAGTGLTTVKINNVADANVIIKEAVFADCYDLTEVYLPESVSAIGDWTFTDLPNGAVIYCQTNEVADLLVCSTNGEPRNIDNGMPTNNYNSLSTELVVDATMF